MNKYIKILFSIVFIMIIFIIIEIYNFYYTLNKKVQYNDLMTVKFCIMNDVKLNPSEVERLDQNQDKLITSSDYVLLKNKIN